MSRVTVVRLAALAAALVAGSGFMGSAAPAIGAEQQIAQARATPGISPELQRTRFEAAMGGLYADPVVRRYVIAIGDRLTSRVELTNEYDAPIANFEYRVLDSPSVGAFVMPPGSIYVTRGLLAVASDEAEVAAAIAHELAHVALGHAQRVAPEQIARNREALVTFNRETEIEADLLSLEYLARAGYDPSAQASMLRKVAADFDILSRLSELQRRPSTVRGDTQRTIVERLNQVETRLKETAYPTRARAAGDRHLEVVNGLVFGDLPNAGLVRGRAFYHSGLRLTFEAPAEFSISTGRLGVFAAGPGGASMDIERREVRAGATTSMAEHLRKVAARGLELTRVEETWINGMQAAVGSTEVPSRQGSTMIVHMAAMRFSPTIMLWVRYAIPASAGEATEKEVARSLASFRAMSAEEAQRVQPLHVNVVRVAPGETVESLAARMLVSDLRLERFLALNGIGVSSSLTPGTRVKLIAD